MIPVFFERSLSFTNSKAIEFECSLKFFQSERSNFRGTLNIIPREMSGVNVWDHWSGRWFGQGVIVGGDLVI